MPTFLTTPRLSLSALTEEDDVFTLELLNTLGWLKFIGDRKVNTLEAAKNYIRKILGNKNIQYWVVRETQNAIGVITLIKRDYLDYYDIGFAFLPIYEKKGYAYEAANAVLTELLKFSKHKKILATTLNDNTKSIRLLEKLGFKFEKEIKIKTEYLSLFAIESKH